eukprot:Phypoly_transcript_10877.p1 GENE.Phypoly_transcript_10877~~Phypoly_transcript_10877.p1  ORF type:complete len:310 (+),score=81.88 Phypoly_transcript_10877:90-1019(+)
MVELSEYEQQRLDNIARNNAVLNDLQIDKIPVYKKKEKIKVTKKRKFGEGEETPATRRSARLLQHPVELKGSIMSSSESEEEWSGEEEEEEEKTERSPPARRPKSIKVKVVPVNENEALYAAKQPLPTRDEHGTLHFASHPAFTPNLTPKEILQLGSFGGGYFRPIRSGVTGQNYKDDYKEFPDDWFEGLDVASQVTNPEYDIQKNHYKAKAGQGLKEWEASGWIVAQDPRGWFQWYCRFYTGRRSPDDQRQISRWSGVCGPNGRWKKDLLTKIMASRKSYDDKSVSPIVRQTLQHWAFRLTEHEFNLY